MIQRFDPTVELRPLPVAPFSNLAEQIGSEAPLAYDVYRLGDDLCVDFDVPGVDPSAIHLALEDQYLTISVTRELPGPGMEMIERGRVHGLFERRLVFPSDWQLDELRATTEHGVLHLRAPRRPAHEPRTIAVEAAPSSAVAGELGSARVAATADFERAASVA